MVLYLSEFIFCFGEFAVLSKETPPKKVTLDVEIKYDGDNKRPSEFIVKYEIDGKYSEANILNLE
ncbi:hypothetical protein [Metabacillus fastidiosus]|uniref:hypothetical protein n=1 Tax=Metabacillus fastidiosus TaxID=1458 RepID=UPI003D27001D